jgi:hypothetical protein
MRKSAVPGAVAAALLLTAAPSAHADVSGAFGLSDWTVRAAPTTDSAALARIHALGHGHPDSVPCWVSNCTGQVKGRTYRCKSGGQQFNTWTPLNYGRKGWVADKCVGFGRIA